MNKEIFTYRPDGDLNEIIPHQIAKGIVNLARKSEQFNKNNLEEFIDYLICKVLNLEWDEINKMAQNVQDNKLIENYKSLNSRQIELWIERYRKDNPEPERYEIIYSDDLSKTEFRDKKLGISVVLTCELEKSEQIMEGSAWGGLSSDWYNGYILYPDDYKKATLVAKNVGSESLEDALIKANIPFYKIESDWATGLMATQSNEFQYEYKGEKRWAYEYSQRTEIDDFITISLVFSGAKPITEQVISFL